MKTSLKTYFDKKILLFKYFYYFLKYKETTGVKADCRNLGNLM